LVSLTSGGGGGVAFVAPDAWAALPGKLGPFKGQREISRWYIRRQIGANDMAKTTANSRSLVGTFGQSADHAMVIDFLNQVSRIVTVLIRK